MRREQKTVAAIECFDQFLAYPLANVLCIVAVLRQVTDQLALTLSLINDSVSPARHDVLIVWEAHESQPT